MTFAWVLAIALAAQTPRADPLRAHIVANREPGENFGNWNAFYGLGFGPGERFAYVVRVSGEGADEDRWNLVIQDLKSDSIVYRVPLKDLDEKSIIAQSSAALRAYGIQRQQLSLESFPLHWRDDVFTATVVPPPSTECPPSTIARRPVLLRSNLRGSKSLGMIPEISRWIDCIPFRNARIEGFFRPGKDSDRIAVVVSQEVHGFEGELTTSFHVFGASLVDRFTLSPRH